MVDLEEYAGLNPFDDHPELRSIWDEDLAKVAEEGVCESLAYLRKGADIGQVLLIKAGGGVVGITGYFPYSRQMKKSWWTKHFEIHQVGLRWHGILPGKRRLGYSTEALSLLPDEILKKYHHCRTIVELIPDSDKSNIEPYFANLGFSPFGDLEKYDWHPSFWQPYAMSINDLKNYRRKNSAYIV